MDLFRNVLGVDLTNGKSLLAAVQFIICMVCIGIVLVETIEGHDLARKIVFPIVFLYIAVCVYKRLKSRLFRLPN